MIGCAERDITLESELKENFTQSFVKKFGPFQAESWSEAVSTGITVSTAGVSSLEIVADIEGTRYLFADLGHIEGEVAIPINIPRYVKEVILVVDGVSEIKARPGAKVNLDKGTSRFTLESNYTNIDWSNDGKTTIPDFAPNMEPGTENTLYRKVKFTGAQLNKILWNNASFLTGQKENFDPSKTTRFYGSKYQVQAYDKYAVTVYPLYWQPNRYGESDYLVGIYFFKGSGSEAAKIEMHDLFEVKDMMTVCNADGVDLRPVDPESPFTKGSLSATDNIATTGYTVQFDNGSPMINYGFYVKSGLKDTAKEGFGRECEHISFQEYRYNSHEWGNENAWAVNMEYFDYSYSGCASAGGAIIPTKDNKNLTHLDTTISGGLEATFNPDGSNIYRNHGSSYNMLGFTAPPTGYDTDLPDFSDCVLMVDPYGQGGGRQLVTRGEGTSLFPWYLAAEDLGGSDDWDFNDLIVTIYDVTTDLTKKYCSSNGYYPVPSVYGRRIVVEPVATGATMPIYLMYEGAVAKDVDLKHNMADIKKSMDELTTAPTRTYVIGTEIHKWLGAGNDTKKFINVDGPYTADSPRGRAVSFCVPVVKDANGKAETFDTHNLPQLIGETNQTMRGFWVLVDKDNTLGVTLQNPEFDPTPIAPTMTKSSKGIIHHNSETELAFGLSNAKLGDSEGLYRVDVPINESEFFAPQMLMCHYNWQWCKERETIDEVYSSFADWVAGRKTTWHSNPNLELGEGLNAYDPTKVCTRAERPTFIQ